MKKRIWVIILACVALVLVFSIWRCNRSTTIAIQQFGQIDQIIIDSIAQNLIEKYGAKIEILETTDLPKSAYYSPRNRYRADSLIAYLKRERNKTHDFVIGLTTKDISTTKGQHVDWGIFGLGYRPGPSCVVSTFRLKSNDQELFLNRLEKVALHEIGHNLGLPHCDNHKLCVMNDAHGTVKEVDENNHNVCGACKVKLGLNKVILGNN
ncbi:MAG: Zn-dependent protease [Bacteroidia bacterium]